MFENRYEENNQHTAQDAASEAYTGRPATKENAPKRKTRSNKKAVRTIAGLAIACMLIGGTAGGLVTGAVLSRTSNSSSADASSQQTASTASASLLSNSSSNTSAMTPQQIYEQNVNAVVAISNEGTTTNVFGQTSTYAASGSGFIVTADGYIVTNNHVIDGAEKLTVMLTSGEEYEATVVGADEENDVALLKIDAQGLPTVTIGNSDNLSVGEQVCAIGNPLGELTNTLTVGYVSALDREISEESGAVINMFQTDCAINSGNSGGPLFDADGNVIGITTAKYSSSSSSSASIEGIGFCIPINDAVSICNDLQAYGYVKDRASLGVSCQTISSSVTQYYNLPAGVYVAGVNQGSAAETAGIETGDIITSIDGTSVESVSALKAQLKTFSAGDTVTVTVYRSGKTQDLQVTLDEKTNDNSAQVQQQSSEQSSDYYDYGSLPGMFGFSFGSGTGSSSGSTGSAA